MIKDESLIGRRIRVINLAGEPDYINKEYKGKEGVISYIDDIGQYHITWDGADKPSGLAVIPEEDKYELLESKQVNRYHKNRKLNSDKFVTEAIDVKPGMKGIGIQKMDTDEWVSFTEYVNFDDVDIKEILESLCYKINNFLNNNGYSDAFDMNVEYIEPDDYHADMYAITLIGKNYSSDIIADREKRVKRKLNNPEIFMHIDLIRKHRSSGVADTYYDTWIGYSGFEEKRFHTSYWSSYYVSNAKRYVNGIQSTGNIVEAMWSKVIGPVIKNLLNAYNPLLTNEVKPPYSDYIEPEETFESNMQNKYYKSRRLNESFMDDELTKLVTDHDGLKKPEEYDPDARIYVNHFDIRYARPCGYIPKDIFEEYFTLLNSYDSLNEQLLMCNDGGAIVIAKGFDEPRGNADTAYETPYQDKIHGRGNNYRNDMGQDRYIYIGMDQRTQADRKRKHFGYDK